MEQDSIEQYEKIHKISQYSTLIGTAISILLNIWVALSLMTDLMGIRLGDLIERVSKYGWQLPPDWVQRYQPFLTALQWVLLTAVIVDTGISFKYMQEGEPKVPLTYLRIASFIAFFCGLWLYLAYKVVAYGLIFFAGLVTLCYSLFVKKEEEEEETEEFEGDIWKETASIFDPNQF